ncbi:hypothetical protein [Hymenobacter coccineus]|uniref:hypothetical protein n=1 Tax=Hymenobacter coccineus TaxID=1908235 RepID=UPI000F7B120C|nr:hypothetical protein [Hymenobacter coccineus]
MIRLLRLLPALLLLALAARAQNELPVQPLPADPSRAAPARGPRQRGVARRPSRYRFSTTSRRRARATRGCKTGCPAAEPW